MNILIYLVHGLPLIGSGCMALESALGRIFFSDDKLTLDGRKFLRKAAVRGLVADAGIVIGIVVRIGFTVALHRKRVGMPYLKKHESNSSNLAAQATMAAQNQLLEQQNQAAAANEYEIQQTEEEQQMYVASLKQRADEKNDLVLKVALSKLATQNRAGTVKEPVSSKVSGAPKTTPNPQSVPSLRARKEPTATQQQITRKQILTNDTRYIQKQDSVSKQAAEKQIASSYLAEIQKTNATEKKKQMSGLKGFLGKTLKQSLEKNSV